jgi:hypothetical protein
MPGHVVHYVQVYRSGPASGRLGRAALAGQASHGHGRGRRNPDHGIIVHHTSDFGSPGAVAGMAAGGRRAFTLRARIDFAHIAIKFESEHSEGPAPGLSNSGPACDFRTLAGNSQRTDFKFGNPWPSPGAAPRRASTGPGPAWLRLGVAGSVT